MEAEADRASQDFRFFLASALLSTACHHCDWLAKRRWLLVPFLEAGPIKLCSLSHWRCLLPSSLTVKVPIRISSALTSFTSYQIYQPFPASQTVLEVVFSRWPFPTNFIKSKLFRAEEKKNLVPSLATTGLPHWCLDLQIPVIFPFVFLWQIIFKSEL